MIMWSPFFSDRWSSCVFTKRIIARSFSKRFHRPTMIPATEPTASVSGRSGHRSSVGVWRDSSSSACTDSSVSYSKLYLCTVAAGKHISPRLSYVPPSVTSMVVQHRRVSFWGHVLYDECHPDGPAVRVPFDARFGDEQPFDIRFRSPIVAIDELEVSPRATHSR